MPSYAITGANRGIGFAFVRQLSAKPENVVFALVRNLNTTEDLKNLKRSNVHILKTDISDVPGLKAAAAEVAKVTGGSLDMLINNAAYLSMERMGLRLDEYPEGQEQLLEEDLLTFYRVNVIGVVHTINIFLPLIKKGSLKKVIVISSGAGDLDFTLTTTYDVNAPYSISKAAVNMAVAKYAGEYKEEGIAFLALSPGMVNTTPPNAPPMEDLEWVRKETAKFKKQFPDFPGALTPDESVSKMLKVIDELSVDNNSGAFLSHNGNKKWL
ncbi:NAD(P)-binding protein [Dentipellis sp. KUC8613]|nr:NAD(P)-binding protein [Dentipellis sp. KUC8613]